MRTTTEVEPIIRNAVEAAIRRGYLVIADDWGVLWDDENKCWRWDPGQTREPACCAAGAVLVIVQPKVDPTLHKGDQYDAAAAALDVDKVWLRDFMNGFDGLPYQGPNSGWTPGGFPDAHRLGVRIAAEYQPCSIVALTASNEAHLIRPEVSPLANAG